MKIKEGGGMDIQEKKAFEIAFDKKLGARGCQFDLDEDGNYEDRETLCGWHMWLEAKAQAVPERTNQTFEDWLSDPENTKVYFGGYRERANEFAHQAWMASLKAKLPKDKILMPRSLDQKHIDYVVHQLAISSGASLISEVYGCLIEAQEPAND